MKKASLIISFLLISILSQSQNFYGGVLAGFNGSQIEGDGISGYNKMGLVAGTWMQTDINEQLYWGAELKYNQKGSRKNPTKINPEWYAYRLNYIDLPVLAGYRYRPYLSFIGGLSFGYLVNKSGYGTYWNDPTVQFDNTDNWELSMLLGVKADFDKVIETEWAKLFTIDVRYNYSLISTHKDKEFFFRYSRGTFNNVISFVLFYRMEWGKFQ